MIELREDDFDDWDEDGYDPDDDWYDEDYDREPDPEDWEIARSYEELYEHEEKVHGGQECNCKAPLRERVREAAGNLRRRIRHLRRSVRRDWDEPPF